MANWAKIARTVVSAGRQNVDDAGRILRKQTQKAMSQTKKAMAQHGELPVQSQSTEKVIDSLFGNFKGEGAPTWYNPERVKDAIYGFTKGEKVVKTPTLLQTKSVKTSTVIDDMFGNYKAGKNTVLAEDYGILSPSMLRRRAYYRQAFKKASADIPCYPKTLKPVNKVLEFDPTKYAVSDIAEKGSISEKFIKEYLELHKHNRWLG